MAIRTNKIISNGINRATRTGLSAVKNSANNIEEELSTKCSMMLYSLYKGNYRDYSRARKEFYDLAANNMDIALNLPKMTIKGAPGLFNVVKTGIKVLKIKFLDLFHIKSANEKLYRQRAKEEVAKRFVTKD